MSTRRRRRITFWALGLATVLTGPTLTQAQLFPDLPIRRQRPCCNQEDPRYNMVREVYFGYYPTCWRQFPEGWGCYPKTGMPDWQASLEKIPLGDVAGASYEGTDSAVGAPTRRRLPTEAGPIPGAGDTAPPNRNGGLPPLPPESGSGSLFDQQNMLQPPSGGAGVNNPPAEAPQTTPAPTPNPALLPGNDDLFNPSPGGPPPPPPGSGASLEPTPSGLPRAGQPVPAAESPAIEAPTLGSGEIPSTSPEVLLEGELPQAPPLGAPGPVNAPVSSNFAPIPNDPPRTVPPTQAANPPKRAGFLANILGRTRKR